MTVIERLVAAGFDPAAAKESWGNGSVDCVDVEIKMTRCRPDRFTDAIMVSACGCHPYTDGTVRPAPSWYGDEVWMIFPVDTAPFEFKSFPFRV